MNEQDKQAYNEQYKKEKKKGVYFFPDIIFKDTIASLILFLALVALAFFVGVHMEERANPSDSSYIPRPEWYFLFLFQFLKYFPGELEVIGVIIIPIVVVALLFFLPFLDRSPHRHFMNRPVVTGIVSAVMVGIVVLTIMSIADSPPPAEAATGGDMTAALFSENCAGCHGTAIEVGENTDLHDVIASGGHAGMPAWSGDLSTDEIDALAGFILAPEGSRVFTENCGECHEVVDEVIGQPLELKKALEQGPDYEPHGEVDVPDWGEALDQRASTALLNFLVAPDGNRLFAVNCSACHGYSIQTEMDKDELTALIKDGGMHLEMPAWQAQMDSSQLEMLASYVMDAAANPEAEVFYNEQCESCHQGRLPVSESYEVALEVITSGGSHRSMPVWGEVLTDEQITALVEYSLSAADGSSLTVGQNLYTDFCASCHGDLGEGGINPANVNDIIPPISTEEYLKTRDDITLSLVISQGQPNFGMSPFGSANGGPLDEDQIDAVVAYIRSWEANPPYDLPPEFSADMLSLSMSEVFIDICMNCHAGTDPNAPSMQSADFQYDRTDQDIFDSINLGHETTSMLSWGEILSSDQIQQLVELIRALPIIEEGDESNAQQGPSFILGVKPILEKECQVCHGAAGGWKADSYENVVNSGDSGPAVVPGEPENSSLVTRMLSDGEDGDIMPPAGKLAEEDIQVIVDWVAAGAPDN
jgi:mono/diheme cytochrome c family protein